MSDLIKALEHLTLSMGNMRSHLQAGEWPSRAIRKTVSLLVEHLGLAVSAATVLIRLLVGIEEAKEEASKSIEEEKK